MKAILVIDMPKSCAKCKLEDFGYCWGGSSNVRLMATERSKECPLKPMPEKNTWDITKNGHVTEYAEGYNACLDEILGETE